MRISHTFNQISKSSNSSPMEHGPAEPAQGQQAEPPSEDLPAAIHRRVSEDMADAAAATEPPAPTSQPTADRAAFSGRYKLLKHVDGCDDIFKLQGVPWLARKAIVNAPVSKKVSLVGNRLHDATIVLGLIKVEGPATST